MKEEDAKKKWCPMVRMAVASDERTYSNRGTDFDSSCIASDCMMWVEETTTNCHTGSRSICGGHCGLTTPRGNYE